MKILIEISPEKSITVEMPASDLVAGLPKLVAAIELAKKSHEAAEAKRRELMKLPRFVCSYEGGREGFPREIIASDAFTAAEAYAAHMMPNQKGPWVHTDRDAQKLRASRDRFPHRVKSACGYSFRVTIKEVR